MSKLTAPWRKRVRFAAIEHDSLGDALLYVRVLARATGANLRGVQ